MLICKFASERSAPARIQSFLTYLQEIEQKHGTDAQARMVVEKLRLEAQSWMGKHQVT
jgi:hypothetical protein